MLGLGKEESGAIITLAYPFKFALLFYQREAWRQYAYIL